MRFRSFIHGVIRGRWHRLAWRGRDGERGAILVVASVATVVALGCTALAVDLGKGVHTKRDLQEAVDNAAVDAVLALGDRYGQAPGLTPQQHATKLARDSLQAHGYDTTNPSAVSSFTVTLGKLDTATNSFVAGGTPSDSVQVSVAISRARNFMPGTSAYQATGVSSVRTVGGIAVGSWLARVNNAGLLNSVLGGLAGSQLTLAAYSGLAAAKVSLGALRQEMGFATLDDMLKSPMQVKQLLEKSANALLASGDPNRVTAADDLKTLAHGTDPSLVFTPRDLIRVCPGTGSLADAADISALTLAQSAFETAIGTNLVTATLAPGTLGALGALLNPSGNAVTIKILEPPQIAIGPPGPPSSPCATKARTAQIRAQIHLRPLGTILGGVVDVPVFLEVAAADTTLTGITCANPVDDSIATVHANTSLVRARIGTVSDINAANPTVNPGVVAGIVTMSGDVSVGGASNQTVTFGPGNPSGPFGWSKTKSVGGTSLGLANLLNNGLHLGVLGLDPLGLVTAAVGALVRPILAAVDSLTDPLLADLGVSLGGADATVWSVKCHQRALVN